MDKLPLGDSQGGCGFGRTHSQLLFGGHFLDLHTQQGTSSTIDEECCYKEKEEVKEDGALLDSIREWSSLHPRNQHRVNAKRV